MKSVVDKLKTLDLLKDCSLGELSELSEGVEIIRINADLVVFDAGAPATHCYILLYGSVKMMKPSPNGRQMVMCFLRPPDLVAAGVMMNNPAIYPLSCSTLEDSGFLKIPRESFVRYWSKNPNITACVQQMLMTRMLEFQQDKALAFSKVSQRIAVFLLRSLEAQNALDRSTLHLKLTRKDIADRVGTSVETVIRILSEWTHKGWIATEEQRITLHNREELQKIVDDES